MAAHLSRGDICSTTPTRPPPRPRLKLVLHRAASLSGIRLIFRPDSGSSIRSSLYSIRRQSPWKKTLELVKGAWKISSLSTIDAKGGVISRTPHADARAFLQLDAAHRLVARGASTTLQDLATLGMLDQVKSYYKESRPTEHETNCALWNACHGGQLATAKFLREMGGDCHFVPPWDDVKPLGAVERSNAADVVAWLRKLDLSLVSL